MGDHPTTNLEFLVQASTHYTLPTISYKLNTKHYTFVMVLSLAVALATILPAAVALAIVLSEAMAIVNDIAIAMTVDMALYIKLMLLRSLLFIRTKKKI